MVSDFKVSLWRFFIKSVIGHINTVNRVQSIHSFFFLVSTMATQEDAITIHSSTISNPASDCSSISSSSSSSSVCLAGQFETVDGRFQFIPARNRCGQRIISPSSPPRRNRPVAPPLPADIKLSSPEEDGSTSSIETCAGAGSTCSTSSWFRRLVGVDDDDDDHVLVAHSMRVCLDVASGLTGCSIQLQFTKRLSTPGGMWLKAPARLSGKQPL
jgi:hypothetical protein